MNPLRALLDGGAAAVGSWCVTPSTLTAEVLTSEAVDYVCFDCQHGMVDSSTLGALIAAVRPGVAPFVRVPGNDAAAIGKALDLGAGGVIIPMVGSAEEAAAAVAACRYAPEGTRSYGPLRAALALGAEPADLQGHPLCFVMIETPAAVARADEICAVPGLGGVYVGPADLAVGLGIRPSEIEGSAEHAAAVATVREACARAGVFPGIHTSGGADAHRRLTEGFRLVSLPTDAVLLRSALHGELAAARGG
ncbi:MAG TPA: aldolase/citrate lyase family protein [Acidimicrobiales bacterium]|nr:aldolase/citrate lyase family protein [Acidimicrobiales bacterium]